jgi:4'-phosphopantetheinyl transferase
VARARPLLSDDERARADRFVFPHDRDRFVLARAGLRRLLAHYLDVAPAAPRFVVGPQGKPALPAPAPLCFNLSHSGALALYAFTLALEVGVDVEAHRPEVLAENIAEHFFAPGEVAAMGRLAPEQRLDGFFACWTRKEAYIKARGLGLAIPLDSFHVALAPADAALLWVRDEPEAPRRWSLRSLAPGDGYSGALAVPAATITLRCFDAAAVAA